MNRSTGKASRAQSQRLLNSAQVICATCIGSGSEMLSKYAFHTVLIDECTQATETSVLVQNNANSQIKIEQLKVEIGKADTYEHALSRAERAIKRHDGAGATKVLSDALTISPGAAVKVF